MFNKKVEDVEDVDMVSPEFKNPSSDYKQTSPYENVKSNIYTQNDKTRCWTVDEEMNEEGSEYDQGRGSFVPNRTSNFSLKLNKKKSDNLGVKSFQFKMDPITTLNKEISFNDNNFNQNAQFLNLFSNSNNDNQSSANKSSKT